MAGGGCGAVVGLCTVRAGVSGALDIRGAVGFGIGAAMGVCAVSGGLGDAGALFGASVGIRAKVAVVRARLCGGELLLGFVVLCSCAGSLRLFPLHVSC